MKKVIKRDKRKWIIATMLLVIFAFATVISIVFIKSNERAREQETIANELFEKKINATSKIGVSYSVVGRTERQTPQVDDEGLARYPVYGQRLTKTTDESDEDFTALKQAILNENAYLNSDPDATITGDCSNYNRMDSEGYLYLNDTPVLDSEGNQRKLYKHTASQNMYFGNVEDDEPAVIKQIKIIPRPTGNYITGLYAPAGEVIKLKISAKDLDSIGSFYVYVGATLANGQANNIWMARDFNRMPVIANKMPVNSTVCSFDENSQTYTCFFGSYLGGPIYIGSPNTKNEFAVEISGAVEYPHFIYGLTTEEEYNRLLQSSAPYFDMEIYDNAVRFSGPRTYSDNYSYAELCDSAELWDKISRVSKQVPTSSTSSYGIDFLFEPFVAAGAAVAFVGRNTVNCPVDWMNSCLNVESFVTNGAWGNVHEFNHHFQGFGLPNGGEVTNNAVSLVEYSLFTKISANRSLNDSSLKDWNVYTDASRVIRKLLQSTTSGSAVESLEAYATVLHSFGQEIFIQSTKNGSGVDNWFRNLCNQSQHNLYYYFTELLHETVSPVVVEEIEQYNYPMYVPVACIYQTGTKFNYNNTKKHITTMQPFEFSGESYDFNVRSLIQIPSGFTINDITVGDSQFGHIQKIGDDQYRFTPSTEGISGDIDVNISISKDDNAFEVEDVTLVLGFKQQQKRIAERTTYYFDGNLLDKFEDIEDAVSKNYEGFISSETFDSKFNGNECAAVWWSSEGVELNSISEYNSKIYITSNNTYRFSIRGKNANLYISLDGVNYQLVAKADSNYNNSFNVSVQNGEYRDYDLKKGQTLYIKAVVLHLDLERCAFVVGMAPCSNGSFSLDDITKKTTVYNINYVKESFKSDYFYKRNYSAPTVVEKTNSTSTVLSTNFTPWDETTGLENMFDNNLLTYMHNKQNEYVTQDAPFEIVVDLGKVIKANKVVMYGRKNNPQTPTSYQLFGGLDREQLTLLCEYTNEPLKNNCNQIGTFDSTEIRYYKLVVTKTSAKYICLSNIEFCYDIVGANLISPDDSKIKYYGQWEVNFDLSLFGHSYISNNGRIELEFSGSQFAILSKEGKSATFSISIDGQNSIVTFDGSNDYLYLSNNLQNKTHKIIITPITTTEITAFVIK